MRTPSPSSPIAAVRPADYPAACTGQASTVEAAMMARSVRRHRPQSPPAPQASAICFDVDAPDATRSLTVWLVTPWHRQTNINSPALFRWWVR